MPTWRERNDAQLRGQHAAIRAIARLRPPPDRQVDVFGIIERAEIWLLFEPLNRLYGFYDPGEDAPGIVLHSGHPTSLQRFTAAHEFGHHLLGHQPTADDRETVLEPRPGAIAEIEAQAFAGEFLMPLALVNRCLTRLGLENTELQPVDVYQMSLELGASYTATITRLEQANVLDRRSAQEARSIDPIDLKTQVGGRRPENARADVWTLDPRSIQRRFTPEVGDEIHVRLPETPSTGYRWQVDAGDVGMCLSELADEVEPRGHEERIGRARTRHLHWRTVAPGRATLRLQLARSWEPEGASLQDVAIDFEARERATGDAERGSRPTVRRQLKTVA